MTTQPNPERQRAEPTMSHIPSQKDIEKAYARLRYLEKYGATYAANGDISAAIEAIEQLRSRLDEVEKENAAMKAKLHKWNTVTAAGCTPSGSEYHDDPERCAVFLKDVSATGFQAKKDRVYLTRERDQLRLSNERMERALLELRRLYASEASGEIARIVNKALKNPPESGSEVRG